MVAMQKVAWVEVLSAVGAVVLVSVLLPWMGHAAHGGFGLLGLVVVGAWFVRGRGQRIIVDERDRAIEHRARDLGIGVAWQGLFLTLIGLVFWSSLYNDGAVPTIALTWLIWVQFAVCYGVKGASALLMYRRQNRAA